MFAYDPQIATAAQAPARTIPDVLEVMQTIASLCSDADGLKWFNWLYMSVTEAVKARIEVGGFSDPVWLAELDVNFANLYFGALRSYLTDESGPDCWRALFSVRSEVRIARIQFAMAGINAHINHDLPEAIVETYSAGSAGPQHGSARYMDYTNLNSTLDSLIETAKRTLKVRLPGERLPDVTHLDDAIAAWGTAAAREQAWNNSVALWQLKALPEIAKGFLDSLDGITTFAGKTLLAPVP